MPFPLAQGSPPFVTRRIVQNEEIRVPGNVTKAELWPKPGVQYGLQICAFYAERENADVQRQQINPFQILPVIPFTCTPCRNGAAGHHKSAGGAGCIDCSKIEEIAGAGGVNLAQSAPAVDCLGPMCASANRSSVHFISSDTVMLDVFGAKVSVPSREVTGNSTNEAKTGVASWDGGEKEEGEEARHGWTAHNRQWHSKTVRRGRGWHIPWGRGQGWGGGLHIPPIRIKQKFGIEAKLQQFSKKLLFEIYLFGNGT